MDPRTCAICNKKLSPNNPGLICQLCQEKLVYERASLTQSRNLNVEDMRLILGLETQEQVKRLGRAGKLPRRIPVIKKWLWREDEVRDWIRSGYVTGEDTLAQVKALIETYGSPHRDEITGKTVCGDPEDIQVMVYSTKNGNIVRETKKISTVNPRHH